MTKYRLKKEAVRFFKEELKTAVHELECWRNNYNVDENALEEVEHCFVSYGFETEAGTSLCGWGNPECKDQRRNKKGAHFHFTLHFPSMKYEEYDRFKKGESTRELMNIIQKDANKFYESFNNGSDV